MQLSISTASTTQRRRTHKPISSKNNQKNIQIHKTFKSIGIVEAYFQNLETNSSESKSYSSPSNISVKTGIGFLISRNKVLTAAQNLFNEQTQSALSKVIYYPFNTMEDIMYQNQLVPFSVKQWKINQFFEFNSNQSLYINNFAVLALEENIFIDNQYLEIEHKIDQFLILQKPILQIGFKYDEQRSAFIKTWKQVNVKTNEEGQLILQCESSEQQCGSPLLIPIELSNQSISYKLLGHTVGVRSQKGISFAYLIKSNQISKQDLQLLGTEVVLMQGFTRIVQNLFKRNEILDQKLFNYQKEMTQTIKQIGSKYVDQTNGYNKRMLKNNRVQKQQKQKMKQIRNKNLFGLQQSGQMYFVDQSINNNADQIKKNDKQQVIKINNKQKSDIKQQIKVNILQKDNQKENQVYNQENKLNNIQNSSKINKLINKQVHQVKQQKINKQNDQLNQQKHKLRQQNNILKSSSNIISKTQQNNNIYQQKQKHKQSFTEKQDKNPKNIINDKVPLFVFNESQNITRATSNKNIEQSKFGQKLIQSKDHKLFSNQVVDPLNQSFIQQLSEEKLFVFDRTKQQNSYRSLSQVNILENKQVNSFKFNYDEKRDKTGKQKYVQRINFEDQERSRKIMKKNKKKNSRQ